MGDGRRQGIIGLCGLWAVLLLVSLLLPWHTAPTGDGFTRGLNRIALFFQVQAVAGGVAVAAWWLGRGLAPCRLRWLSRGPLILTVGMIVMFAGAVSMALITGWPP